MDAGSSIYSEPSPSPKSAMVNKPFSAAISGSGSWRSAILAEDARDAFSFVPHGAGVGQHPDDHRIPRPVGGTALPQTIQRHRRNQVSGIGHLDTIVVEPDSVSRLVTS